jgi:hypothetical protein
VELPVVEHPVEVGVHLLVQAHLGVVRRYSVLLREVGLRVLERGIEAIQAWRQAASQ